MMRFRPNFSRRTWFSLRRYSITCCCWRFIQPAMATTRKWKGFQVMAERVAAGQGLGKGRMEQGRMEHVGPRVVPAALVSPLL
jgi:hypothetical protein